MKRAALVMLTALALVALVGCGGSGEENDYVNQVNAADAKAQAAFGGLGAPASTPARAAKSFDAAANKLEPVVADYEAIDPPSNASDAHAETIAGVKGLVTLLRSIADDFRGADTQKELDALTEKTANIRSERPFRQLDEARAKLAKAGYKVQGTTTTTR